MARLADNFWISARYSRGTRAYERRQDIWHRDRIDPTILPPTDASQPSKAIFVGPPALLIEDVEETELAKWPYFVDHFDDPAPWLTGLLDARRGLIAYWSESVNEKRPNNLPDPLRRQIQAFVSLVAHKAGDRQQIVDEFLRNQGGGIDGWSLKSEHEGYFAHEYGLLDSEEISFWSSPAHDGANVASPIVTGFIENDTDRSIEESIQYTVPHPRIRHTLALNIPDPRNTGLWLLGNGNVFLRKLTGRGSPLLLDKEYFDQWCQSEGLEYTWVYIGERTAWIGPHNAIWRRTPGAAWFEDGKIRFKNDRRDG